MGTSWISDAEIASAQPLTFVTYMSPGTTGWDRSATYSSTQPFALSRDDFAITLTRGATYDIFSASYFDPIMLRIQDSSGNLLANDVGSSFVGYGTDVIFDFVPQYTGTYYISASWDQGSFDKFVWLAVYEDLDTVPKVPSSPMITVNRGGVTSQEEALPYSGPVVYLQYQYLGTQLGEVAIGTNNNDFINLLGGDDAANAGAGDDVIDGGTGSNFLSGGSGKDVFFLDGRGGKTTWATITDWQFGEEVVIWGWKPGVSRSYSVEFDGAAGYTGATMHADLDGNGHTDTSVTISGMSMAQVPGPRELDGLLWLI